MNSWTQYGLRQTVAPVVEPVSLDSFKLSQRISWDDEDSLLQSYLAAGRSYIESMTGRQFVTATWQQSLDSFPHHQDHRCSWPGFNAEWKLARNPVQTVSITYIDVAGTTQTLDPSTYILDTTREQARIVPAYLHFWPVTRIQPGAVTATFVAGYGSPSAVPPLAKHCITLLAAHFYENRESVAEGSFQKVPMTIDAMLASISVGRYP